MEKTRDKIWNLLLSKGYAVSAHSSRILKKEKEFRNPDSKSEYPTVVLTVKYKFGKNNLQKFTGDFKNYSIPFCRLDIVNGKIVKKE